MINNIETIDNNNGKITVFKDIEDNKTINNLNGNRISNNEIEDLISTQTSMNTIKIDSKEFLQSELYKQKSKENNTNPQVENIIIEEQLSSISSKKKSNNNSILNDSNIDNLFKDDNINNKKIVNDKIIQSSNPQIKIPTKYQNIDHTDLILQDNILPDNIKYKILYNIYKLLQQKITQSNHDFKEKLESLTMKLERKEQKLEQYKTMKSFPETHIEFLKDDIFNYHILNVKLSDIDLKRSKLYSYLYEYSLDPNLFKILISNLKKLSIKKIVLMNNKCDSADEIEKIQIDLDLISTSLNKKYIQIQINNAIYQMLHHYHNKDNSDVYNYLLHINSHIEKINQHKKITQKKIKQLLIEINNSREYIYHRLEELNHKIKQQQNNYDNLLAKINVLKNQHGNNIQKLEEKKKEYYQLIKNSKK